MPHKDGDAAETVTRSTADVLLNTFEFATFSLLFLWGTGILDYCSRRLQSLSDWIKADEGEQSEEEREGEGIEQSPDLETS